MDLVAPPPQSNLRQEKKMALFNLLCVSRSFFFTIPLSLVHALQNLKQTLWRRWQRSPALSGENPALSFPNLLQLASPLSSLDTVWGSLFWLCGQTQLWCNHSQEDLMLVLVFSAVRLMITIQFRVVSRKVLSIGRKRRGRYNTEQPAKQHKGRTEAGVT